MKPKAIERMRHMELAAVTVDNPHYSRAHSGEKWNPPKSAAVMNIRESAISLLAAKGVINAAQVAAADRFRGLWETLGGSGAGALDYTKEPVDGGGVSEPITVKQLEAGRQLKAASKELKELHGEYAYRLVGYIAGEGRSIHEMTETRRQRDTMTDNLRTYLDILAALWGYSTDRNVSRPK